MKTLFQELLLNRKIFIVAFTFLFIPVSFSQIPMNGLQLWLKSDAGIVLNGSNVSSWQDQSGNGYDAIQSNMNRQPIFVDNELNGKPVLRFDGSNDKLGFTGSLTMTQISFFIVIKQYQGATNPDEEVPLTFGGLNMNLGKQYFFVTRNPYLTDPNNHIDVGFDPSHTTDASANNIAVYGDWKNYSIVTDQTVWNTTIRWNGNDATIANIGSNASLSVVLGDSLGRGGGIGGADNVPEGTLAAKCDVAELIVYNNVVSYSDRVGIENYLANKYDLPVLPVELTSFNSSIIGNNIQLIWQTATETNDKGFEIYRNGNKITFVDGKGTTTEKQNYLFTDKGLQSGIYNYRLNQIDFDGTQKVVGELTVHLILPEHFSLEQNYPNPFNPSTKIKYSIPTSGFVTLKVYDVLGKEIATLVNGEKPAGSYEVEFNAANLSSGIYFYKLQAGDYVQVKKMMPMK